MSDSIPGHSPPDRATLSADPAMVRRGAALQAHLDTLRALCAACAESAKRGGPPVDAIGVARCLDAIEFQYRALALHLGVFVDARQVGQ